MVFPARGPGIYCARVVARHLVGRGHRVKIVSYDRGYRNLKDEFELFETEGLHIARADNNLEIAKFRPRYLFSGKRLNVILPLPEHA